MERQAKSVRAFCWRPTSPLATREPLLRSLPLSESALDGDLNLTPADRLQQGRLSSTVSDNPYPTVRLRL
eukprot:5406707-Pyramimonas_sp.AAC.1